MKEVAKEAVKEAMASFTGEKKWELAAVVCAKDIPSQLVNPSVCLVLGGTADQQAAALAQAVSVIPYVQQNMVFLNLDTMPGMLNTTLPGAIWESKDYVWMTLKNSTSGSCGQDVSCIFTLSNVTASATTAVVNLAYAAGEATCAAQVAAAKESGMKIGYVLGSAATAALYNYGIEVAAASIGGAACFGAATYIGYQNWDAIKGLASKCFRGLFSSCSKPAAVVDVEQPRQTETTKLVN